VPGFLATKGVRNLVQNNLQSLIDRVNLSVIARNRNRLVAVIAKPSPTLRVVPFETPNLQVEVLGHLAFGKSQYSVELVDLHPQKTVLALAELTARDETNLFVRADCTGIVYENFKGDF
jgi:hypothetical protein